MNKCECVEGRGAWAPHAFTLPELIVSAALLAFVSSLLLGITRGVLEHWAHADERAETLREARAALGQIERDISQVVPLDGVRPLLIRHADSDEICLFTAAPQPGRCTFCAVGYRTVQSVAGRGHDLVRARVDPAAALAALGGPDPILHLFPGERSAGAEDGFEEVILSRVWGWRVVALDAGGREIPVETLESGSVWPSQIEVALALLDRRAAAQAPAPASAPSLALSGSTPPSIRRQWVRHRARIPLPAAPCSAARR